MSARIAVVTGSAGGIGRATVRRFEAAEWTVIGLDLEQGDLADAGQSAELFADIAKQHRKIDALVNNAAVQLARDLVATEPTEWDRVLGANLRSAYLGVRHAHPLLKAAAGSAIVNVCSVHALVTSAGLAAYVASKGALLSLTRALAIELAGDCIRVNAVLPGAVDTPMLRAGIGRWSADVEDGLAGLAGRTVLGRIGRPEEIAEAIYFLADGERSAFITGQALVVDGGASVRLSTEP